MKNVTLSCGETLIRAAREKALRQNTTLNAVFRQWMERYVGQDRAAADYEELMERLGGARAGARFSRDELNERA